MYHALAFFCDVFIFPTWIKGVEFFGIKKNPVKYLKLDRFGCSVLGIIWL